MDTFNDYMRFRESMFSAAVPSGLTRPSSKVTSCKERARRLSRKFHPRITPTVKSPLQRPRMQVFRWSPVV